jgi:hypothetical protein
MLTWLKRISTIGITLVMLEAVAWVGLTLFGAKGITALPRALQGSPATETIVSSTPTHTEKCSTFDGALYCIQEATEAAEDKPVTPPERCTAYDGALHCIAEDV